MSGTEIALIITALLGVTGIGGVVNLFSNKDQKKKAVTAADLPPVILDPQVAVLREQVVALTGLLGDLAHRVDVLEQERDQALRDVAHGAALLEQSERQRLVATGYVVTLRNHIADRKEPPAPDWPTGWIH